MPAIPEIRLLYKNFAGDQADQIGADGEAKWIQLNLSIWRSLPMTRSATAVFAPILYWEGEAGQLSQTHACGVRPESTES
jgi:hypothetical protein